MKRQAAIRTARGAGAAARPNLNQRGSESGSTKTPEILSKIEPEQTEPLTRI
jgi:hypothetical protein